MSELVLYFSNQCKFCKNLIAKIGESEDVANSIKMLDIQNCAVPKGIASVPAIVDMSTSNVYVGKTAFELVETLVKKDINPFEMGFGSNTFSFVSDNRGLAQNSATFSYIGEGQATVNTQPEETQSSRGDSVDLEKLIEARNRDVQMSQRR